MPMWTVEIVLSPAGRETLWPIVADSGAEAVRKALDLLKLKDNELLHTLYIHVGAPHRE